MCRWVAYAGPEIYLEDLIFHQEHSIVSQSLAATQSAWVTNGDGFGVAWYTKRTRLECSKISCQLGMIVICVHLLRIFGPGYFLHMFAPPRAHP